MSAELIMVFGLIFSSFVKYLIIIQDSGTFHFKDLTDDASYSIDFEFMRDAHGTFPGQGHEVHLDLPKCLKEVLFAVMAAIYIDTRSSDRIWSILHLMLEPSLSKMVRKRSRKTEIGLVKENVMLEAVKAVLKDKKPLREAAREFNIPKSTLQRYVMKSRHISGEDDIPSKNVMFKPNYTVRQIFTTSEDNMLSDYFTEASNLHHGLLMKEARKLAYEYAMKLNKNIPSSWQDNLWAGRDWLEGFIKRAGNISLRKPEATSLARSMGFNKPVVAEFYSKLYELLQRHQFEPDNIFNLDETGLTTVQTPGKVIAKKGVKQVGQVTSSERGELVTLLHDQCLRKCTSSLFCFSPC